MKLTNKQHIDLLNAFILNNTDYKENEFTGGSVSNTLTHNNTQIHYKINLYFGYKNKRPITNTVAISEEIYSIMYKAITLKIKSLLVEDNVFNANDIKSLLEIDTSSTPSSTPSSDTPPPTPTNTNTNYLPTINTLITNTLSTNSEIEFFNEYVELRKKMKLSNSDAVIKRLLNKLVEYEEKGFSKSDVILNAINSSWKDFYEPKQSNQQNQKPMSFKEQERQRADNIADVVLNKGVNPFDTSNYKQKEEFTDVQLTN